MLTLNDGRSELWQWDTSRKLTVDNDCSQVHFSNKVFGRSIDVDVVDGVAIIPDILLQTDKELTAWAFVGTPENGYTKISKTFKVNRRNKPSDYVFTSPDQTTLNEILDRIEDLENRPSGDVSEEDIQNAVNDYLEKNPVSIDEKDPTVPAWAKQPVKPSYTAAEVGALPDTISIPAVPSALPNPHKLTIKGAVKAEYDGSEAVTVTIPDGSPDGDYIPTPTTAEIGQTIVVKAVDENGKPTEWEAADMPSGENGSIPFADYELIASGTTTEAVGTIVLNKDSNGNAFELKECVCILEGIVSGSCDNFINDSNMMDVYIGTNVTRVILTVKRGEPVIRQSYNGTLFVTQANSLMLVADDSGNVSHNGKIVTENIVSVAFRAWSGDFNIGADTKYALYGVRA